MIGDSEQLVGVMREAAVTVSSVTVPVTDELRALKRARDALDVAICERLEEMQQTRAYEAEDATGTTAWARRELHQDDVDTRLQLKVAQALTDLPIATADAAHRGEVSFKHLARLSFSLRIVGRAETLAIADEFLGVATTAEPAQLKQAVDHLRDVIHPDDLDENWIKGQAKEFLTLAKLPDGWHLAGFLSTDLGARFKAVLDSLAVPIEAGDTRSAMARKLDGLHQLLAKTLENGLPTDGTVRPQIHVLVEAGTLKQALHPDEASAFRATEPATLVGFGHIGPQLLAHLVCDAELTPVLVDTIGLNTTVLDVGRSHRYATAKQREAIWIRQRGRCATEHCRNPIDHIHHEKHWVRDHGETNLADMTGRCHRCHVHIHRRAGEHVLAA